MMMEMISFYFGVKVFQVFVKDVVNDDFLGLGLLLNVEEEQLFSPNS
jgi:hypothetical protein